jgi:hypothetical protein
MEVSKLRKYIIKCGNMEEMKKAFDKLKAIGEPMARKSCGYREAKSLKYSEKHNTWGDCWPDSFSNRAFLRCEYFMGLKIKANREAVAQHSEIDTKELRKHTIGPFESLDEMRQAWEMLRLYGGPTARTNFEYTIPQTLSFSSKTGWGTAGNRGTMTPQELVLFLTGLQAVDPAEAYVTPQVPDHDCSLHWYVSLGCCVKCNKDLDPRNKAGLYGILDEERRQQEFIAEVKRGRK